MAQNDDNKSSWLTSASPIIGGVVDLISGVGSGLFNANQARKNRAFQERMYYQQLQDNRENWNMQNEYNHPLAVRQRMESAGLNPLLMYGDGGSSLVTANTAQGASAPSGAQASMNLHTQFAQAAAQSALINAQIRNLDADSEQKQANAEQSRSTSANLQYDLMFKKLCQNVELAIKHGSLENLSAQTNNLVANTLNTNEMTFQTALTMRQARLYEIKRFDLDYKVSTENLEQGWQSIANDTQKVKQGWRQLALNWIDLQNQIRWTTEQIGALRWSVLSDKAMFMPRFRSLSLDNQLKVWDTHLKKADFNYKQTQIFNQNLRNYYYMGTGTETPSPLQIRGWHTTVAKPQMQDLLVIPPVGSKLKIKK